MFDELKKYKHHDHFFFRSEEELATVCNAPKDKSGVYIDIPVFVETAIKQRFFEVHGRLPRWNEGL